jgi:hypothetical protein
VHSIAPALVRSFGGDLPFGKVGGPPRVSAFIPPLQFTGIRFTITTKTRFTIAIKNRFIITTRIKFTFSTSISLI